MIFQHLDKDSEKDVCASCHDYFEDKLHVLMDILEKQKIMKPAVIDDYPILEGEYSDELSYALEDKQSPAEIMQIKTAHEESMWRGESETSRASDVQEKQAPATDFNVPQCLLSDSQSSDITSPKETETPRSTISENTT